MLGEKWVSGSADCLTDEKSNADEMFRYDHEIKLSALQTGGGASPPSFEGSLLPGTPHKREQPTNPTSRGEGGEGGSAYIPSTYIPNQNAELVNRDKRVHKIANGIKKFA